MRKGKSLIGLSVVGQVDGTQLGRVRDLIFDHETGQALALVLSDEDLFGLVDARIVPWREVQSLGSDVIFVRDGTSKISLKQDERARHIAETHRETALAGTHIMTSDGHHLGTLADMFIDEVTGQVVGYEVSGGFVSDTLRGKKFLPAPPNLAVGKDAAIVPPSAAAQLENAPPKEP